MKIITFIILLMGLVTSSFAGNDTIQRFFGDDDSGVFQDLKSGQLLRSIIEDGQRFVLEQNGDIFEEDVATIEEEVVGLRGSVYSFSKSKRLLATQIYPSHPIGFYSTCRYEVIQKKLIPIHNSCGFNFRKNKNRSERIEWEHVVPAWLFGHQLQCWQKGGRLNCRKTNPLFKQMEADMHNLVPAIGEINGDRSNYKYGMIEGEARLYGKPDMEIAFANRLAEPPKSVYGDIARTYFYMVDQYDLKLSQQQVRLFIAWNNLDPVDDWERKKNKLLMTIQGDENRYISHYKKLKQGDVVESGAGESFDEVKTELAPLLSFLWDYLPVQIAEGLLILVTLWVVWRRRSVKKKKDTQKQTPSTRSIKKNHSHNNKDKNKMLGSLGQLSNTLSSELNSAKTTLGSDFDEKKVYFIKTKLTNKYLSIDNKEQLVILEKQTNEALQHWQLIKSNKTEGFVFIKQINNKQVLEVGNHLAKDGSKIVLSNKKRRSNNHQEWKLILDEHDSEWCFVRNRETGYYLDVLYKKTHNGSRVASYHKKIRGYENQSWQLIEVD